MRKEAEVDSSVKSYAQTGIASLLTYAVVQKCHGLTQIQGGGKIFYLLMWEYQGHIVKEHEGVGNIIAVIFGTYSLPHLKKLLL